MRADYYHIDCNNPNISHALPVSSLIQAPLATSAPVSTPIGPPVHCWSPPLPSSRRSGSTRWCGTEVQFGFLSRFVLVHLIVDSIVFIVDPDPVVRGRAAVVDPALLTHNGSTPSPI
jgi:hypothetical protein